MQPTRWLRLADAPTERLEVAAARADGKKVYVAGGMVAGGTATAIVEVYDPVTDRWSRAPDLPVAVHHAMAVTLDDEIVVIGGFLADGSVTREVWRLRFGAWQPMPPLAHARAAGGAAVVRGQIVVVGGQDGSRLVPETEIFDGTAWRAGRAMPTPRDHLGVAGFQGAVYAVAGRTLSISATVPVLERYDVARDRWASLPGPGLARGGIGVGVLDGKLVVVGGEGDGPDTNTDGVFRQVEAYDFTSRKWRRLGAPMPLARHGVGAVVIGDAFYVAVGGPVRGGSVSARLEALKLEQRASLL